MKTPKKSSTRALTVTGSPFAAARQHAERACQIGTALYNEVILCGLELIRLKDAHGLQRGGDRKSKSHGETLIFEDLIEREVGISRATAFRWMQVARAQLPAIAGKLGYLPEDTEDESITVDEEAAVIELVGKAEPARLAEVVAKLSNGKTLEQLLLPLDAAGQFDPAKLIGKAKDAWQKICALCDPYDDDHIGPQFFSQEEYNAMHEGALTVKERIEAGELAPTRAWAGLRGRAAAGSQGGRSATDHPRNFHVGLTKLRTSFAAWEDLDSDLRNTLETEWEDTWKAMPDRWKALVKKMEGWK